MFVVIFSSLLAIFLSYLSQFKKYDRLHYFELAFGLLTFLACIHFDYGTDYSGYYYKFLHDYNDSSLTGLLDNAEKEPLWAFLNWIFPKPYGFFTLVALISVIQNYCYYSLIKYHVPKRCRWISMALYVGITSFYLLNFSMIRQGFTVSLIVLSGIYLGQRKWIKAVIIILVASTIHLSSLCMLPFVAVSFLPLKNGKFVALSLFVLIVALFITKGLVGDIFTAFTETESTLSQYSLYQERVAAEDDSLGMGFLLNSVLYVVFFYFILKHYNEFTFTERFFLLLSCVPLCLTPFQMEISGLIGRLGLYFSAFQIVTIPITYSRIKVPLFKFCAVFIYSFMLLRAYYVFFMDSWATDSYCAPFKTIFSVIF